MRTFSVGHDHGNSRTTVTVYINGKEEMRTFPSATADGSLKTLATMRQATGGTENVLDYQALRKDEYVLTYDGADRFVGNLAVAQGTRASTGRDSIHRYWSRRSLETLLTAAADMIPDPGFELLVVTGLPVATFNEETRKKVKEALNGTHRFILNGRERVAYVKVGKVLMEGAGASLLHDVEDSEDIYGFIDIGGRTTDFYARQGLQPIAKKCKGIDIGVEVAADKISMWFEEKHGFALTDKNRTDILQAFIGKRKYPAITARRMRIPELELVRWAKKAFSDTGSEIAEEVSRVWHTGETGEVAAEFSQIDIVGGGAYYFLDALRTVIPDVNVPEAPEHANARGYGWFAEELLKQRRIAS